MGQGLSIPAATQTIFKNNFSHEVQQRTSRLRGKYTTEAEAIGGELIIPEFDAVSFQRMTGRLQPTNPTQVTVGNRRLVTAEFSCPKIFDRNDADLIRKLEDPKGSLVQAMGYAWDRTVDTEVLAGMLATAYGGERPYTTAYTLGAGQTIAVNYNAPGSGSTANAGLTPAKLARAKKILRETNMIQEGEVPYLAMAPQAEEDLYYFLQTQPNDVYATLVRAFLAGDTDLLMGFRVCHVNGLPKSSTTRTAVAWLPQAVCAVPEITDMKMSERDDLNYAPQVVAYGKIALTRRNELGVLKIECDEFA